LLGAELIMPFLRLRLRLSRAFIVLAVIALISFVFRPVFYTLHAERRAPDVAHVLGLVGDDTPASNLSNDGPIPEIPQQKPLVMTLDEDELRSASVHQSWMEYPEPLSCPDSPSLLETHFDPLKILLVNFHPGVENEVKAVVRKAVEPLNMTVQFTQIRGVGDVAGYHVTDEAATAYYPLHPEHCDVNRYDVIIGGDVLAYSRPYLQAACKTNIILYSTNRFDFQLHDPNWAALLSSASRWPNVRFIINNLYEPYYLRTFRHVNPHVYGYAPSTGLISATAEAMQAESEIDWSHVGHDEFLLDDRAEQHFLIDLCLRQNVPPPRLIPHRHGGPLPLAGRFLVHIPYQVNVMSLFENLNVGAIFIVPSIDLYWHWLQTGGPFFIYTEDPSEIKWTKEELWYYVDWWRPDLSKLFFYFDSLDDLAPGSAFRERVVRDAPHKQKIIKEYMTYHVDRAVEVWRQALASFPRLSEVKCIKRQLGLVLRLSIADLPRYSFGLNTDQ
jgi:hypothetical protein